MLPVMSIGYKQLVNLTFCFVQHDGWGLLLMTNYRCPLIDDLDLSSQ